MSQPPRRSCGSMTCRKTELKSGEGARVQGVTPHLTSPFLQAAVELLLPFLFFRRGPTFLIPPAGKNVQGGAHSTADAFDDPEVALVPIPRAASAA